MDNTFHLHGIVLYGVRWILFPRTQYIIILTIKKFK